MKEPKIIISDTLLFENSGFGTIDDKGKLVLFSEEALYLLEKEKIELKKTKKKELKKLFEKNDEFRQRYLVFRDLKKRGFVVKSGLKYGTHFRVYERGVKPKKGKKKPWEHAKFLVHTISSPSSLSTEEISRFVRLTQSVKKKLWLAIVDTEEDITYFQIMRITP